MQSEPSAGDSAPPRLEQYGEELYRFLLKRLRRRHEAEDLLQSVYLRFLQTPHTELVRQPRAYLYRIATNLISEFTLRNRREPVLYDSDAALQSAEQALPETAAADALGNNLVLEEQLQRIVSRLPRTYRTVLLLRAVEGLSFGEIGKRCGITEQSARKYLVRAMAQCRMSDWRD